MSNFFSRVSGGGGQPPQPPRQNPPPQGNPYGRAPPSPGYGDPQSYGRAPPDYGRQSSGYPPAGGLPGGPRMGRGPAPGGAGGGMGGGMDRMVERKPVGAPTGQTWSLTPAKSPTNQYTFGNIVAVSPQDFNPSQFGNDFYLMLNDMFVLTARPFEGFMRGQISLSDPQRTWMQISLQDTVHVRIYDPFYEGGDRYLGNVDLEVGFAGRKSTTEQLDQDELAKVFIQVRITAL